MTEKEMLLNTFEREYKLTNALLHAFTSDTQDFKPNTLSLSAKELSWKLINEQCQLIEGAIAGEVTATTNETPASMKDITDEFDRNYADLKNKIQELPDTEFNVPITIHLNQENASDMRRAEVIWLAIADSIFHRGKLSVYLTLAGGALPSEIPNTDKKEDSVKTT